MPKAQHWSRIHVESSPPITDPRELTTILTFSLRDLFGDFEPHSCMVEVTKQGNGDDHNNNNDTMIIKCPTESVKEVRAALTLVTPPSYILTSQYRFDILSVSELER